MARFKKLSNIRIENARDIVRYGGVRASVRLCDGLGDLSFPPITGNSVICYRLCFDEGQITNRLPEVVMMASGIPLEDNVTHYALYNESTIWTKAPP